MLKIYQVVFIILIAAIPASCETLPQTQTFPELTFGYIKPLRLNVDALEIVSEYSSPMKAPNVEHLFPTPPGKALRRWAADRLQLAGTSGLARFVIVDASATETALKVGSSLADKFTNEQSRLYTATVEVRLEVSDARNLRKGFASAKVSRSKTLPEGATINEKERLWFDLTEALMKDFNAELDKNIRKFLGAWLM